jgi:hypothetical protein
MRLKAIGSVETGLVASIPILALIPSCDDGSSLDPLRSGDHNQIATDLEAGRDRPFDFWWRSCPVSRRRVGRTSIASRYPE